jgi:AraC family transcriptional regulator
VYVERVNAAVDYIEQHLADELTLEEIASVAHFSPFHFHRIFSLMVGESLSRFITRLRMEKAATWLVQHPDRTVTEIAAACGLSSPSSFARLFRETFDMSATEWRNGGYLGFQKESVLDLLNDAGIGRDDFGIVATRLSGARLAWEIKCGDLPSTLIHVIDTPDLEVAYVRYTGRYQGAAEVFADIFTRLMTWAGSHDLIHHDSWLMAVYHDNPTITEDDKLRVSACLSVPADTQPEGDIGRMRLDGGKCAVGRFELGTQDYSQAWFAVAGGWLPESGYEPDDRLPFERYPLDGSTTSAETEVVEICMPVRPLRRY